jgi:hypothetical protein
VAAGELRLAVAPDGGAYLFNEREATTLWKYDSTGKLLGSFGRKGRGPTEFQHIRQIGFRGDTLWVIDNGASQIRFFGPAGNLLLTTPSTARKPEEDRFGISVVEGFMPDGSLLAWYTLARPETAYDTALELIYIRIPRSALTTDAPPVPVARLGKLGAGRRWIYMKSLKEPQGIDEPWPAFDLASIPSNGSALALVRRTPAAHGPFTWNVRVIGSTGVIWARDIPYTPQAITAADWDAKWAEVRHTLGDRIEKWSSESAARRAFEDSATPPPHHAAVADAILGNDTTLWVRLPGLGPQATWKAFDASGRPIYSITIPASFKPLAVSRSLLWGVETSAEDELTLVRYRL